MRSIQILVDPPLTQTPNCKLTETIAPVSDHPLYPAKPLPWMEWKVKWHIEMYEKAYSADAIITKILLKKEHKSYCNLKGKEQSS